MNECCTKRDIGFTVEMHRRGDEIGIAWRATRLSQEGGMGVVELNICRRRRRRRRRQMSWGAGRENVKEGSNNWHDHRAVASQVGIAPKT